jgi:hypothetical protein
MAIPEGDLPPELAKALIRCAKEQKLALADLNQLVNSMTNLRDALHESHFWFLELQMRHGSKESQIAQDRFAKWMKEKQSTFR